MVKACLQEKDGGGGQVVTEIQLQVAHCPGRPPAKLLTSRGYSDP